MADKYSTIQQHQPLRTPAGWSGQEKSLVMQLDEIFDDIYRRFGRLRLEDFGTAFRKRYEDTEGNVASLELDVTGLTTRVSTAEGNVSELTVGVTGLTTRVGNAEGDISALQVQADSIELSVANKYDKVSGITIEADGIKLTGSKYIQLLSGSSIDIKTGGQFTIDSGNFLIDQQGNVTINGNGYFSGELRAATGTFAGTLDAGCITSGTMSANRISGGTIDARDVTITNLDASSITTGTLSANMIHGGSIDAAEITIQNLSSNSYIQSVVGDWQSQSTITQTINGISSRISSLGYGTVYYSETEPDHNNLTAGDVWIEPIEDNTWDDIAQYTWDELGGMTWEQVAGQYRMHVWTGNNFKLLFDNMIVSELQTQINQNAYAITLKADESLVDQLSGQVTQFEATLEVQAEQIQSAVSSVNSKTANYTRLTDPSTDSSITLSVGDTWTKAAGDGTWDAAGEYTWDELADLTWDEIAGASVYSWDGSGWVQTADYGAVLQNRTLITQTSEAVEILAEKTETIDGQLVTTIANLTVANDRITQEVNRATAAEGGKIDKTTQYQTADSIVTEAVSQAASAASGSYVSKTNTLQTADQIVTEAVRQSASSASGLYVAKTSTLQTADSIVTEAVRQANESAWGTYIAKTSTYQSATAIVNEAVRQSATAAQNGYIAKTQTYQTADSIVLSAENYADGKASTAESNAKTYANNNFYGLKSGISILAAGVEISGGKYIKILSGSTSKILLDENGIDMQTAGKFYLHAKDATNSAIIMGTNKQSAAFSVGQSGDVTCKSITTDSITVNGGGLPKFVISESEPSGTGLIWIKPSSATSKTWAITPNPRILSKSPSSLGNNTYYEDYTISYSAEDYLAGNLKYGVTVKLWFYGLSTVEQHTLKARLKNGNSWIDLGSITQNVWQYNTLTLDVMLSSAVANVMSVTGGSFTLRIESTAGQAKAQLPNENIVLRAQTSGGSGVATCAVFYKQ